MFLIFSKCVSRIILWDIVFHKSILDTSAAPQHRTIQVFTVTKSILCAILQCLKLLWILGQGNTFPLIYQQWENSDLHGHCQLFFVCQNKLSRKGEHNSDVLVSLCFYSFVSSESRDSQINRPRSILAHGIWIFLKTNNTVVVPGQKHLHASQLGCDIWYALGKRVG